MSGAVLGAQERVGLTSEMLVQAIITDQGRRLKDPAERAAMAVQKRKMLVNLRRSRGVTQPTTEQLVHRASNWTIRGSGQGGGSGKSESRASCIEAVVNAIYMLRAVSTYILEDRPEEPRGIEDAAREQKEALVDPLAQVQARKKQLQAEIVAIQADTTLSKTQRQNRVKRKKQQIQKVQQSLQEGAMRHLETQGLQEFQQATQSCDEDRVDELVNELAPHISKFSPEGKTVLMNLCRRHLNLFPGKWQSMKALFVSLAEGEGAQPAALRELAACAAKVEAYSQAAHLFQESEKSSQLSTAALPHAFKQVFIDNGTLTGCDFADKAMSAIKTVNTVFSKGWKYRDALHQAVTDAAYELDLRSVLQQLEERMDMDVYGHPGLDVNYEPLVNAFYDLVKERVELQMRASRQRAVGGGEAARVMEGE